MLLILFIHSPLPFCALNVSPTLRIDSVAASACRVSDKEVSDKKAVSHNKREALINKVCEAKRQAQGAARGWQDPPLDK